MKDLTWFWLAVRLTGLVVLSQSLQSVAYIVSMVKWTIEMLIQQGGGLSTLEAVSSALAVLSSAAQIGIGVYLLLGGKALVAYVLADARRRCPQCQYSTHGLTTPKCPECGAPLAVPAAP